MVSILIIIGGHQSLRFFPTKLTSVVVYCFLTTIILPLFCSSILHTQNELKTQPGKKRWEKVLAYCYAILLSPIRPFLIAEAFKEYEAKRKAMGKFNKESVLKLNKEGRKLRRAYSNFIKVDLGLEVMFQLSGQVCNGTSLTLHLKLKFRFYFSF